MGKSTEVPDGCTMPDVVQGNNDATAPRTAAIWRRWWVFCFVELCVISGFDSKKCLFRVGTFQEGQLLQQTASLQLVPVVVPVVFQKVVQIADITFD